MASESEIISAIEGIVSNYHSWKIGLTDNPDRSKQEHGSPEIWHQWNADSETSARKIEKHFLDKKMRGTPGGGTSPNYVYIFMI
jgi:hypothetical protein